MVLTIATPSKGTAMDEADKRARELASMADRVEAALAAYLDARLENPDGQVRAFIEVALAAADRAALEGPSESVQWLIRTAEMHEQYTNPGNIAIAKKARKAAALIEAQARKIERLKEKQNHATARDTEPLQGDRR